MNYLYPHPEKKISCEIPGRNYIAIGGFEVNLNQEVLIEETSPPFNVVRNQNKKVHL